MRIKSVLSRYKVLRWSLKINIINIQSKMKESEVILCHEGIKLARFPGGSEFILKGVTSNLSCEGPLSENPSPVSSLCLEVSETGCNR